MDTDTVMNTKNTNVEVKEIKIKCYYRVYTLNSTCCRRCNMYMEQECWRISVCIYYTIAKIIRQQ